MNRTDVLSVMDTFGISALSLITNEKRTGYNLSIAKPEQTIVDEQEFIKQLALFTFNFVNESKGHQMAKALVFNADEQYTADIANEDHIPHHHFKAIVRAHVALHEAAQHNLEKVKIEFHGSADEGGVEQVTFLDSEGNEVDVSEMGLDYLYAALIYYVDRATGENELTVIKRDYQRDVIDDSIAEQAAQALLQELEIQAVHPLSSEKVAFIYLPDSAETVYLSDTSGQSEEIRTMAVAKAIAFIADFDSLGIKAVSFDFDGYDGAIDIINADTKEPLVLDGGSEKAMFESIFNALHKDRFIERVESGNAIIDFQNNEIKGNFVELIGESKCSTVSKDKELLTKDELDFFNELNQTPIDHIQIAYGGSGDSSDGYGVTYHDEKNKRFSYQTL